MSDYMFSDINYDYYGSKMNRTVPRVVRNKRPGKADNYNSER